MSKKPHLPDTPFDVNSPTLAGGETRTLPACVEPRCRAVRRVALVTAVLLVLYPLFLLGEYVFRNRRLR